MYLSETVNKFKNFAKKLMKGALHKHIIQCAMVLVYPEPAEHKKFKPNMVPPITPELSRLRQKGHKSVANLVYTERKKLFDIPFRRKKFVLECVCVCVCARLK